MIPQGSSALNADYFSSLIEQVNMCTSCAELQSLTSEAFGSIEAFLNGIAAQTVILGPLASLLTAPAANPTAIVTWITTLIDDYLTPQLATYTTYATKVALLTVQITELTNAITNAQSRFTNCAVTLPTLTIPSIPPIPGI
jgi:hypothetical protein